MEFELSPGLGLRLVVAVSEGDVENTTSKVVRGLLLSCGLVAWGESDGSLIKSWGKDVVPFFLGECVSAIPNRVSKTWLKTQGLQRSVLGDHIKATFI